jgi:hypothetical protein
MFKGCYPSIRQVKAQMPEKPFTAQELEHAGEIRMRCYIGYCPHDPLCPDWRECVKNIARTVRKRGG